MMRFLLLMLFLCTACKTSDLQLVENRSEDGTLLETYHLDAAGQKQSEYKRYVGEFIRELCHYRNDTLHGMRIIYDTLGQQRISETYQMGSFEGAYKMYYGDGTTEQEGTYTNNAMEGIWTTYYPSGQVKEEVTMTQNEENGPFKEYHLNGKIKAVGQYLNGPNEDGNLKIYDENGDLEREMKCTKGVCRTVFRNESE